MARFPSIENLSEAKIQLLKKKVVAAIKERNLVQRKVAEKAGVAATSLNRILNAQNPRFTSEHTAKNLARAIGLPYEVLIDEDYDVDAVVKYIRDRQGLAPVEANGDASHVVEPADRPQYPDAKRTIPPYVSHVICRVGIDESVRRLILNADKDVVEATGCGPLPDYLVKMVEAIGPLRALKRILVKPETGEVSL